MLSVKIIAVGSFKERYWTEAAAEYEKRLSAYCKLEICELQPARLPSNPSPAQLQAAMEEEGDRILQKLPDRALSVALCVEGKKLSSEGFSEFLADASMQAGELALIIGGSDGLSDRVKTACKRRISFSDMTFPHQLMRVILLEQLYRGFSILAGGRYHK